MTTIAYRGGVMAADTQLTSGNRKFRTSKVVRLSCGGLLGSSGNMAHICKVQRWAEAGFDDDAKPDFEDDGEFECIVVKGDGTVYLLDGDLELMPVHDEFTALGSGGPYAVAAMACGKSPEEAVKVAAQFDAATSEPVQSWVLEAPKVKQPPAKLKARRK